MKGKVNGGQLCAEKRGPLSMGFSIISIKQENLTVAVELEEDGYEKSVSCEELLLAAYDAISRIFTQKALVKAYYNTNPDTIDLRDEDDPVRQLGQKYK